MTLRTIALALIRDSTGIGDDEASRHLTEHLCAQPPSEWRFEAWWRVEHAVPKGHPHRRPLPDAELIEAGIQTRFWRFLRQFAAPVWLGGNSARYYGPPFIAPVSVEVERLNLHAEDGVFINPAWRIALHLSFICLRLGPLLEALRRGGAHVDPVVDRLRAEGRLPAIPAAPVLHRYEEALIRHHPQKGDTKKAVAERLASTPEEARHIQNWLSANDDVWLKRGGDPVRPRRAKRRAI